MKENYVTNSRNKETKVAMESIVSGWRESGLSRSEYCRENNITVSKFYYWNQKIKIKTLYQDANPEIDFLQLCNQDVNNKNKLLRIKLPNGVEITFY